MFGMSPYTCMACMRQHSHRATWCSRARLQIAYSVRCNIAPAAFVIQEHDYIASGVVLCIEHSFACTERCIT
jgi:hypothetical protein